MTRAVRKKIPDKVKLIAALKRMGLTIEQVQFDHNPALALRPINPLTGDTIPPANDPDHIELLMITEHQKKTYGKSGEKVVTTAGSDIGNIAKVRRLTQQQEEARRRMLAKDQGEKPECTKSKWPKRPFPKRQKKGT
ncbi:conserved protein of unknown function [Pseudorhizobium banfieldiae]|uniref:Uncharacterized protein n=1 Tax=Pseudorhizobium banfieldiae TaxID=1125847 RepID=L0NDY3_9HYPH|nr:hypothetical protein [Pseudorhizobium banfieldiae]CAD6605890.1 HNH endonuclease [arsenite-oxidising bacterium NT-25]CCF19089.1 conserved protein of unknown function [Pseudorhizobium banfieldiae]